MTKSIVNKVPGTKNRITYKVMRLGDGYGDEYEQITVADPKSANVISSRLFHSSKHAPVLDIDVPHALIESSTPGHAHLYLDVDLTWRQYKRLLKALDKAGIIETGYRKASIRRGFTAVRLPWVKKNDPDDTLFGY